jgi:Trp operon repressor
LNVFDTPTLGCLLQEIQGLIEERDELRRELDSTLGPDNRKKLCEREVKEIRNLARVTSLKQREIADMYDVNKATVSRIIRGVYHK